MATHASFGENTGATEVAAAFSSQIQGKVILIIGVSPNSLGESKATALAAHGPSLLILASRTLSKIHAVADKLPCRSACIQVDLSSLPSVRSAAEQIAALTPRIDILINNAAVVTPSHILTPTTNHELQFATTFLGPFLLTNLLLPLLLNSALSPPHSTPSLPTRIVNITSAGHRLSPIRFSDPHFTLPRISLPSSEQPPPNTPRFFLPKSPNETYAPFLAYGQAKSANILFSVALNRRLASLEGGGKDGDAGAGAGKEIGSGIGRGKGIASFAVHPGSIWTELSRNLDEELQGVIKGTGTNWKGLDEGSATALVGALDPGLVECVQGECGSVRGMGKVKGVYLSDCQVDNGAAEHAVDEQVAERLWELAEREVGERFDVAGLVGRMVREVEWKGRGDESQKGVADGGVAANEKGKRVRVGARGAKV